MKTGEEGKPTNEQLKGVAEMFVYLLSEPRKFWAPVIQLFIDTMNWHTLRENLLLSSSIDPTNILEDIQKKALMKVFSLHENFEFAHIVNFSFFEKNREKMTISGDFT